MNVSFGKSAYIPGTPDSILDKMENSPLSISGTFDGTVIVTWEAIQEFIRSYEEDMAEHQKTTYEPIATFLYDTIDTINKANDSTPIGDIFFTT